MKRMTIGVRGRGVVIGHHPEERHTRIITAESARRYARLLVEAARAADSDATLAALAAEEADAARDDAGYAAMAAEAVRPECVGDYETFVSRAEDVEPPIQRRANSIPRLKDGDRHPIPLEGGDIMHPAGRCTCHGEGVCGWCHLHGVGGKATP